MEDNKAPQKMGSGNAKLAQVTPADSTDSLAPVCDPCVNKNEPARGWCGQCGVYLCTRCVSTHNRSHKLAMGRNLPPTRPTPDSLLNNVEIKTVLPVATLEDNDLKREDVPYEERNIRGCVCIGEYIVTITMTRITLYDEEFQCVGEIDFEWFQPLSICSRNNDIAVSFERLKDSDAADPEMSKPRKKMPPYKDVQLYQLVLQSCTSETHLVKKKNFNTSGECFTLAVCPVYTRELIMAAGIQLGKHPEREDIEYIVQIIRSNGEILQTLDINPLAEPCFTSRFFISATMKFGEIIVSEASNRRVRGIYMKTGKTTFEFEGGSPQGLACDTDDNIYVYNDNQLFWIPPLRNKIHYMQQGYKKTAKKENRMAVSLCFNSDTRILYKSNIDSPTIESFRIT